MKTKKQLKTDPKLTPRSDPKVTPRGLSFCLKNGRSSPFVARWFDAEGKRRSRAFETERAREDFSQAWSANRREYEQAANIVAPRSVEKWRAFEALIGQETDPLEVARFWLKYRGAAGGAMRVSEMVEKFLERRKGGGFSADTTSHRRCQLTRLAQRIGAKRACDVTPEDIGAWLAALRNPENGEPFDGWTIRQHLASARLLWGVAMREKWAVENPTLAVEMPKIEQAEITVLSIEEASRLFSANRENPFVGKLALEAFGGLRYTSAARLTRAEIIDADRGIVLPASKHKLGRRHYIDGYPENLWAWIANAPPECWEISQRNYLAAKSAMFAVAGVRNPGNVLRHSFCSYHVSLYKDAARTAVLLTHRSPSMLYQHYRGRASEADAKRYFSIVP